MATQNTVEDGSDLTLTKDDQRWTEEHTQEPPYRLIAEIIEDDNKFDAGSVGSDDSNDPEIEPFDTYSEKIK